MVALRLTTLLLVMCVCSCSRGIQEEQGSTPLELYWRLDLGMDPHEVDSILKVQGKSNTSGIHVEEYELDPQSYIIVTYWHYGAGSIILHRNRYPVLRKEASEYDILLMDMLKGWHPTR